MRHTSSAAFTLIELLVVMAIIAVLATLVLTQGPALLARAQMTGTLNNARQLYMAGFQMATDGATNSDATLVWPGADATNIKNLQDYVNRLVSNNYLQVGDVPKLLSAPGAACTAAANPGPNNTTTVTLGGTSALKVYPIADTDPSNTIFAVSSNYTYDTALDGKTAPYGDKGFIVIRKGGDASSLRKNNAVAAAGGAAATSAFESTVGKKPGEAAGTVTPGDPPGVLKYP
jgi:prepilin-type N-terminal cleavage/methylation domain-containing protein